MDEWIDVVDSKGKPTGKTCLKSFAHQHGILHASVHVWCYTKDGKILLQKRQKDKETFPNLWDVSVAGHIGTGETNIYAAIREVQEEIGLRVTEKTLLYKGIWIANHQHINGIIDREIHHIYLTKLTQSLTNLRLQKEEVSAIKLIHIDALENIYHNKKKFVPHSKKYYQYIINAIKSAL